MLKTEEFWTLSIIGMIALLLAVANALLVNDNTRARQEAQNRSQFIQQSIQLEQLYKQLAQELANRAVRTQDGELRDLLSAQGISINFDAAGQGGLQ
ncbi:MAG: hypothetical protein FJ197_11025 [Gammaproteobacteria bacterium]|nr:hypothetical protein [Gammaproteobacteria bacterium]